MRSPNMSNSESREALRGDGERILDVVSHAFTSEQWAELLKAVLESAAAEGDRGLAQKLVAEAGAKMGLALHAAVGGGHKELADDLLESEGAACCVKAKRSNGDTPLHIACRIGIAEMVRSLLLAGADKDARNDQGYTPLFITAQHGHVAAAQALLDAGADVCIRCPCSSALHVAAGKGHVDFLKMLVKNGADVHALDRCQSTALHHAAWNNRAAATEALVKAGVDMEAQNCKGSTPLHSAAYDLCCDSACALLKHGAVVDSKDEDGSTPLQCAALKAGEKHEAAGVVDILLRSGADETEVDDEGDTAADVVGNHVEEQLESLAEDVERVRNLLANAPVDRAWRRRGYLVLCRAYSDRVKLPKDNSRAYAGMRQRLRSYRSAPVKARGQRRTPVDKRGGREWTAVVARVLRMEEDGLFRMIVGYL